MDKWPGTQLQQASDALNRGVRDDAFAFDPAARETPLPHT